MKTLTELSGTLVRTAARAVAEARRSLTRMEEVEPAVVEAPAKAPPESAAAETTTQEPVAATPPAGDVTPEARGSIEEAEGDVVKAALDTAVAAATGLSGDRLARLRDAVKAVGPRTDDVRLVRVFGPEEPVGGSKTIGGFQYLVDFSPADMSQSMRSPKKERGGGRGGRGGGDRGRGGGGGAKAGATGGFSMDSLREDRKGARGGGGRAGGGRKPGGGRPGGGSEK